MKIVVISDTHSHSIEEIPSELVDALKGADLIVHAGDFTGFQLYQDLKKLGDFKAVRGNMDNAEIRSALPEREIFTVNGKNIGVIHGWGSPVGLEEKIRQGFEDMDIIIYGHTHQPRNESINGIYYFNPGSSKQTYGVLEIGSTVSGQILAVNR